MDQAAVLESVLRNKAHDLSTRDCSNVARTVQLSQLVLAHQEGEQHLAVARV